MATLATVLDKLFESQINRAGASAHNAESSAPVRPFPNEDIFFRVKRIDNSRVVRAADPQAREACWKLIGSVVAAAVLLVAVLLPGAYSLMAGYQIQTLRQAAHRLANERASLELQEAELLSPARMEELARMQQFVDPPPQKVVYLDGQGDAQVAQNAVPPSPNVEGNGK
jgi:cytochrome c-type biogenesis protein CcmH/NrfG